ncbi:MAG TPA: hypothetical protein DDZ92_04030 [Halomonas sp.]|mgnify:CR=1 FL=1|nr:hypothetical protein [Halomonas sp.]
MSNLAIIEPRTQAPVPLQDMQHMANAMAASGFFGFKTPDQALAIMLIAHANGQHPASAAQDYDVIQNNPTKKPQAMLRDFLAAGGKVEWHEATAAAADATFSHPRGGTLRVRWDMARAQQMGLSGKDNYKKQPGVMFRWRCVAEGVRIVYPGATAGLHTPEEVLDLDERPPAESTPRPAIARPAREPYPQDRFEQNFTAWSDLISGGKKTAAQVIAMVESKAVLSDEQRAAIQYVEEAASQEAAE